MKTLLLMLGLISFAFADMSGPRKEAESVIRNYKIKFSGEEFVLAPPYTVDIRLCEQEKRFTACELKFCAHRAKSDLSKRWIESVERIQKQKKCELIEFEESLSSKLEGVKTMKAKCLAYINAGNKRILNHPDCKGATD